MHPKISVITISYNNKEGLEKTIKSVISQDYKDFEYIVIDGGSNDGSKEVLEKYSGKLSHWVSEPDKGVYHAMNKGIKASKGEYIVFVNSGDTYTASHILNETAKHIDFTSEIIYFELNYIFPDNECKIVSYPEKLDFLFFVHQSLPHPGTLIRKKLFDQFGYYNENMKICSDWAFFAKTICKFEVSYKFVKIPVVNYSYDGLSSNPQSLPIILSEKKTFLRSEFPQYISILEKINLAEEKIKKINNSRTLKILRKLGLTKL